jgi:hypothetical protein
MAATSEAERNTTVQKVKDGVIDPWFESAMSVNGDKKMAIDNASRRFVAQLKNPGPGSSLTDELLFILFFAALSQLPALSQFLALSYSCMAAKAEKFRGVWESASILGTRAFSNLPKCEEFWLSYEAKSLASNKSPTKELIALGCDFCRNSSTRLQQGITAYEKDARSETGKPKDGVSLSLESLKNPIVNMLDHESFVLIDQHKEFKLFADEFLDRDTVTLTNKGFKFSVGLKNLSEDMTRLLGPEPQQIPRDLLEQQFEWQLWKTYIRRAVEVVDLVNPVRNQIVLTKVEGLRVDIDIPYLRKFSKFSGSRENLIWLGASVRREITADRFHDASQYHGILPASMNSSW